MAMTRYEAWETETGHVLFSADQRDRILGLEGKVRKLYEFDAATGEEASAIHALRMGWEPYTPMGNPAPCPKCAATFYPDGSGQCWRCGKVG